MGLVPVYAVEGHCAAVDQEPVANNLDGSEPDPQLDCLRGAGDGRIVKLRYFGGPGLYAAHLKRRDIRRFGPLDVYPELRNGEADRERRRRCTHLWIERPDSIVVSSAEPDVLNSTSGACLKRHGAEDAREPPLVLILDVT